MSKDGSKIEGRVSLAWRSPWVGSAWSASALAVVACGLMCWTACSSSSDGSSTTDGGAATTEGGGGGGGDGKSDAAAAGEACDEEDGALRTACTKLCDTVATENCLLLEYHVPRVYDLYSFNNGGSWRDDCVEGCIQQKLGSGCGTALAGAIDCVAGGSCDTSIHPPAPPGGDAKGVWTSPKECATQNSAVNACAKRCLGLTSCDPNSCTGSMSAEGVFCYWACEDDVCKQNCN
jgi:hypothetical protein